MAPSNGIGEVSEVRFQVLNVGVLTQLAVRSSESPLNCVCDLQTILGAQCVSRQSFNGVEIHRKHLHIQGLDAFGAHLVLARLARLREVMVLGLTSPGKPSETLGFHTKARLARLFPPMLTHVHARMRTRRINIFAYRSGLKLTSPNLANLAHGSSSAVERVLLACGRRTALRTDASSLRSRPLSRPSHSSRQWANSGPTPRMPLWHSLATPGPRRMGPPSKTTAILGRGNGRAIRHSLFVLSDPQFPSQRIAL